VSAHQPAYRGRFAPSPTGPLHLGSLVAALASYLDARSRGGVWLVRMEDLDPPREVPGAADSILRSLCCHRLHWDESPLFQSERHDAYAAALDKLAATGRLFHCDCTRAMLGPHGVCQGHCRTRQESLAGDTALRIAVPTGSAIEVKDALQGLQHWPLGQTRRDFVVRRRDGLDAYQLAVVVDDCAQDITHVVRGCDLLDSTAPQIYLQGLLDCPTPRYCHLPVATNRQGRKLSKQSRAPALDDTQPQANLRRALHFLGQAKPPPDLDRTEDIVQFAVCQWTLHDVPATPAIPAASVGVDA